MEGNSTEKVEHKKYCPDCYKQFDSDIDNCPVDGTTLRGPDNDPLIGTVFADRYLIESVLGLGGMSIVYKAQHSLMSRTVAIKMLHRNLKEDTLALERFRLEAQAASSLNHQNVITVYDFGISPSGEPFFVMDCIEGEGLDALIERDGRVRCTDAIEIFKQICDGLEAAHKKGIIHRDLKPANVILMKREDGSRTVKLVDFGIAKLMPQGGKAQQQLTKTGEVFGSPLYMSPEQCLGRELDTRADIYALGCLMYETVAGTPPFVGDSYLETMNMHVDKHPKLISEKAPAAKVPAELEAAILCCLSKDAEIRFQSAGELRDVLSSISASWGGTRDHLATLPGGKPQHRYPPNAKKKVPFEQITVSIVAALFFFLIGFIALFPGAADDRGSSLDKLLWGMYLSEAGEELNNGHYEKAEKNFQESEKRARKFGDHKNRLLTTLRAKSVLYEKWEGHAEELEMTNNEITAIDTEHVKADYRRLLKLLDSFVVKTDSPVSRSSTMLKAEAEIPSFMSTSAKLYSKGLWLEQEELLKKAIDVETKLLGADSAIVAKLETKLAECYSAQRKFPQIRTLLTHALSVLEKHKHDDPSSAVRALNKLGQFDLDRGDYDNAEPELEKALKQARELNLKGDVLLICLRSYADVLQQTNRVPAGDALDREADMIEKKVPLDGN